MKNEKIRKNNLNYSMNNSRLPTINEQSQIPKQKKKLNMSFNYKDLMDLNEKRRNKSEARTYYSKQVSRINYSCFNNLYTSENSIDIERKRNSHANINNNMYISQNNLMQSNNMSNHTGNTSSTKISNSETKIKSIGNNFKEKLKSEKIQFGHESKENYAIYKEYLNLFSNLGGGISFYADKMGTDYRNRKERFHDLEDIETILATNDFNILTTDNKSFADISPTKMKKIRPLKLYKGIEKKKNFSNFSNDSNSSLSYLQNTDYLTEKKSNFAKDIFSKEVVRKVSDISVKSNSPIIKPGHHKRPSIESIEPLNIIQNKERRNTDLRTIISFNHNSEKIQSFYREKKEKRKLGKIQNMEKIFISWDESNDNLFFVYGLKHTCELSEVFVKVYSQIFHKTFSQSFSIVELYQIREKVNKDFLIRKPNSLMNLIRVSQKGLELKSSGALECIDKPVRVEPKKLTLKDNIQFTLDWNVGVESNNQENSSKNESVTKEYYQDISVDTINTDSIIDDIDELEDII